MNKRTMMIAGLLVIQVVAATHGQSDGEWRAFRGDDARGVVDDKQLPLQWGAEENVDWRTELPGRGWSSPVVSNGRIYLTTVTRESGEPEFAKPGLYFGGNRPKPPEVLHRWLALCVDLASGEILWSKQLHQAIPQTPRHIKNSYASETPVTDGERLYVLFGDVGCFCLTLDGQLVWKRELPPCRTRYGWGTAASPILHKDRLFVVNDNEDESYLLALDKNTGDEIWRVDRDEKSNWATPFVWQNSLRTEIITPGTGKVRSYGLDGQLLYEFGGCSSITIARPYAAHGLLYVSSGYVGDSKRPIFAVRPGASGDISLAETETSNEHIAWCQKRGAPYNPSTTVYGDRLYVLHDQGFTAAYDAKTGEVVADKARIDGARAFTASPWAGNGHIFFLDEFGTTHVYSADGDFQFVRRNELPREMYMATPAIADGRLLIRSDKALYCITH